MDAFLAYLKTDPYPRSGTGAELRRLDDMLGEADALRKRL